MAREEPRSSYYILCGHERQADGEHRVPSGKDVGTAWHCVISSHETLSSASLRTFEVRGLDRIIGVNTLRNSSSTRRLHTRNHRYFTAERHAISYPGYKDYHLTRNAIAHQQ